MLKLVTNESDWLTSRPGRFTSGKAAWCPLKKWLLEKQSRSERFWKREKSGIRTTYQVATPTVPLWLTYRPMWRY